MYPFSLLGLPLIQTCRYIFNACPFFFFFFFNAPPPPDLPPFPPPAPLPSARQPRKAPPPRRVEIPCPGLETPVDPLFFAALHSLYPPPPAVLGGGALVPGAPPRRYDQLAG